ncbi:MAG: threonylcarbamoyl-AMP synthase [Candidatus Portnoybacteria bacterium RIFCSPLOWO2_01_FULL_43_11]|uniref:L-threonylcarbamoyladenylate synthase n=4 Tax=Candidatus Portnoyibacteriota TaxID=1817913 RepID=A0A1G2FAX7_9BACT|nr:MAG: threonylcarbamoyl-AMP synthase [Candidatus Portnoybacteria bacterium RIFCSPHIGHO2_01_FULL_40_12b]OGZ36925.1 MAG: threonylcarbamoyl-AMP synthase [Candidatus Portnoybacteria bacterium RIFCSPHIGHO2_02_FULL_40_23]OGZ37593.1 MAG: threonylcarbamoyl-AMP synthase [Candidatus Portnoybacteria bacterium RIFCSPHIGHO2_12_FULL_40_11]OGZ38026.1 MAG: threonylcarbamoyl-AMP synthase [Candidatus Portnoybacteria bacterium RIFCSPLOWO2_01_FULL_43_11]OGZ39799.1 MAG: threonylcarbamoyl-AMP synthase [Candidatus 
MEIVKINPENPEIEIIQKAADVVRRGGAVVFPTDTIYGLGVDALMPYTVERLFKIKKRPTTKPAPILVKDIEMVKKLAFVNGKIERALAAVWPGAVTVVLEKKGIVPEILTAGKRTVGLRIADYRITQLLMEQLDFPLTATSANFSGEPSLLCADEIIKIFEKHYPRPDLILDAGCLLPSPPSTVLDLTGPKPKILRIGPVNKEQLLEILK